MPFCGCARVCRGRRPAGTPMPPAGARLSGPAGELAPAGAVHPGDDGGARDGVALSLDGDVPVQGLFAVRDGLADLGDRAAGEEADEVLGVAGRLGLVLGDEKEPAVQADGVVGLGPAQRLADLTEV